MRSELHTFLASGEWVNLLVSSLFVLTSAIAVVLYASGRISAALAALVLVSPAALMMAVWRPSWLLLGLMAIPPGLLTPIPYRPLAAMLAITLIAQLIIRGRLYLDRKSGLYPLALLALLSIIFPASVGSDAALAGSNFLKQFSFYLLLGLLSYNHTRIGDLRLGHLVAALLIGIVLTAFLKLAIAGIGPVPHAEVGSVSTLFFGRNYAYITVMGFSISVAGFILARESPQKLARYGPWCFGLGIFFLLLTAPSLVRGSWLLMAVMVLVLAWVTRKRSYWLLIPLAAVVVFAIPVARERLTNERASATDFTTGRWELWSTVWQEHVVEGLPLGHGFGYAWSLTPDRLFGFQQFVFEGEGQAEFVYLHSDLLFWLVEYGFLGLAAMLMFWGHVIGTCRHMYKHSLPYVRYSAVLFTGIVIAMLVLTIFGNALALRPLAERFFVVSGFLFGLRAAAEQGDIKRFLPGAAISGTGT